TRLVLLAIGSAGLFAGMLGSLLLTRRIIFPLKRLADGTIQISKGDFTQKIDISSQDEIGELARSFNRMSEELLKARESMESAHKKLLHAEKLASIGRLSASIAHEIRNPLTSVKLNIQRIADSEYLEELEKEHLEICQEGIRQIEKFIKEILSFTRLSEINVDTFSLEQIIDESLKVLSDAINKKKINLKKEIQNNLPRVKVDGDRMRQVFLNLIQNAIEAVEEGGEIKISLDLAKWDDRSGLKVEVYDDGCGIMEKDRENIFEPFYTTKSSGFGLGLANARKIVEQHNGLIRVKERQQKGACFEVLLPYGGEK
ncbi:MAG: sensor histidine kinase, partial [Acidobacteriota bacterium]